MVDPVLKFPMNISSEKFTFPVRRTQTHKPRIILHSTYDFTDIHPINLTTNNKTLNSTTLSSNYSPEKLIERSQQLRLSRLSSNQNFLPSIVSTTNPQSNCNLSTVNKSSSRNVVSQLSYIEQQNNAISILSQHKSSIPEASQQIKSKIPNLLISPDDYLKQINNNENIPFVMDDEFQKYFKKAISKCADWLMKYDFTIKDDELSF